MGNYTRRKRPSGRLTVEEVRQIQQTGTVAQVSALVPAGPDTSHVALSTPEVVSTRFQDRTAEDAIAFIDKSGIAPVVDAAYAAMKKKPGRPAMLSTRAVLVGMQLAVRDSRPLLLTEVATTLFRRLNPPMRRLLDIPDDPYPVDLSETPAWEERTSTLVRRAFHRMLAPIDPSVMPKNRVMLCDEAVKLKKDLSVREQQERATALDWVCNQLLEVAYLHLPEPVRDRHIAKTPSYCIDGTVLRAYSRGEGLSSHYIAADPDAGNYVREGNHLDPAEATSSAHAEGARPGETKKRTITKRIWGREISLLVTADASHPTRLYMPAIPIAETTDIPGKDPAGAARRLFANMASRGHAPGPLAGDILYTNQGEATYQTPARRAGYDLVLGYGVKQTGRQGAHKTGMILVDGTYMAPCIPDELVDIVDKFRTKKITQKEFALTIKARAEYRMRTKALGDPTTGVGERLACPAGGTNPTAICKLKPNSQQGRPTKQPDGAVVDVRRKIKHLKVLTNGVAPKVCQQDAVSVSIEDGSKYRQSRLFASDEQTSLYHRLRQSQEGVHGTAKDEAGVALANAGRRRVRGWAAQQLFAAFLLAETSMRRIIRFLKDAKTDPNGDLYVDRSLPETENGAPTSMTTGSPPGAPPVPADDVDDGQSA